MDKQSTLDRLREEGQTRYSAALHRTANTAAMLSGMLRDMYDDELDKIDQVIEKMRQRGATDEEVSRYREKNMAKAIKQQQAMIKFQKLSAAASATATAIETTKMTVEGLSAAVGSSKHLPFPMNIAAILGTVGAIATAMMSLRALMADTPVPQAYEGGYQTVVGAQDGRKYRAKVMPNFYGGMVNDPSLLVGERGREYVIDNWTLQHPAVANVLPMIEAIRTSKQAYLGGMTGSNMIQDKRIKRLEDLSGGPTPASASVTNNDRLVAVLDRLEQTLSRGIRSTWDFDEFQEGYGKALDADSKAKM